MKLRSAIHASLLKRVLFKGTLMATFGALLLLVTPFLPRPLFSLLGLPILITTAFLIGMGLRPYRKLSKVQLNPHELHLEHDALLFLRSKTPLFRIPFSSLASIDYWENGECYGLCLHLQGQIKVLQPYFDMNGFLTDSRTRFACDLFLPYFTRRSFNELQEGLPLLRTGE